MCMSRFESQTTRVITLYSDSAGLFGCGMRFLLPALLIFSMPVMAAKPNVLFIAIDDLRTELGCYGSAQVLTPNLDKLAGESLLFQRAYCQIAVCGASRCSLMTGVWPTAKRFAGYAAYAGSDAPEAALMGEVFKQAGYTTISNGKVFHHLKDSHDRSWSEPAWRSRIHDTPGLEAKTMENVPKGKKGFIIEAADVPDEAYTDGDTARKTIEDLRRLKQEGKPFFLACGFIKPHMPFYAPKRYWDLYERDKIQIADNRQPPQNAPSGFKGSREFSQQYYLGDQDPASEEFHRMMRHGYLACVSYTDKLVGDVMSELDALGLADNTIVVIWGDNGFLLGEHSFWGKHNTLHQSSRVPLIIRGPGVKAGVSKALVETTDLFPTLCDVAGLEIPSTVQGKSFKPVLCDPSAGFREAAFCRYYGWNAAITEGFSYTRLGSKDEILFDLSKDPQENVNVAGDPAYTETLQKMRKLLDERDAAAAAWKPGNMQDLEAAIPPDAGTP